jgi:hypothetical protein
MPSSVSLWITVVSRQSAIAVVVSLLTGVIAASAPSLRTGEALITITLLSIGLWKGLYLAASWLGALLSP